MQKIIKKVIVLILAITICLSMMSISFAEESNASNFEIENFDIELNVREDNKVEVKETIDVHFFKEESHGIYRSIPIWEKYTGEDGNTIEKRAKVTDFKCDGEMVSFDSSATLFKAKIGDPNRLVPQYKTYNISYTYDLGKDTYKGKDEFIFHAFGDDLGGKVAYGKITLKFTNSLGEELSTKITKEQLQVWKDKCRKENIYDKGKNNDTQTSVATSGDSIVINLSDITGAITTEVVLPEGYFYTATDTYENNSFVLCCITILISISSAVVWFIFGKDDKVETTQIINCPPENLDPAYIGAVMKPEGISYSKYNALAVSLASKGYISIAKDPKQKNNFFVKRLIDINKPLPSNVKELSDNEKLIYQSIFKGNELIVSLKDNKIDETKLIEIDKNILNFNKKIYEKKASMLQVIYLALVLISLMILVVSFNVIKDMRPESNWIYIVSIILWIASLVFTILMRNKTSYGDKLSSEVKAYKEFLSKFNREQCIEFLRNNPKYFYETLPYTYVFGISKNWLKDINTYPDLAQYCNNPYFNNSMMFLAYHYIFINNLNNPSNYYSSTGGDCGGGVGGSSGVSSW